MIFYFNSYVLNMFRTLIYPSTGACDCVVELPHRSSCSQFVVCWRFGAAGFGVVFGLQAEAHSFFNTFSSPITFSPENRSVRKLTCQTAIQPDRPQMTIYNGTENMRYAYRINEERYRHTFRYLILTAFVRQQCSRERHCM